MATAKKAPAAKAPTTQAAAAPAPSAAAPAAKAAPKAAATKVAAPKVSAPAPAAADAPAKRTPNSAFMKPMTPSAALAAVIGSKPMPRTEVTKKVWEYIKKHKLQDPANKRMINADAKLQPIFVKPQVSMFEMTKLISTQLS
jgi:chromatin remodeling complex protein RSC6